MRFLLIILFGLLMLVSCKNEQVVANDYFRKPENRTELSVLCNLTFPPSIIRIPGDTIVLKERSETIVKDNKNKIDVEFECPPGETISKVIKTVEFLTKDTIIYRFKDRLVTDTLKIDDPSKRELLNNQVNKLSADNYQLIKDIESSKIKEKKNEKKIFYLSLAICLIIGIPIIYKVLKSRIT